MLRYLNHPLVLADIPKIFKMQMHLRSTYYTEFPHSGLLLFCGSQGQGKTTSAVQFLWNILNDYPKARFVTNSDLCFMGLPNEVVRYQDTDDLSVTVQTAWTELFFSLMKSTCSGTA